MTARLLPEQALSAEEHGELQHKLGRFYASIPDYTAFHSASDQGHCWEHVARAITKLLQGAPERTGRRIEVLEVGAGRSGFGHWLVEEGLRQRVHWTTQDVTARNRDWLAAHSDSVVLGEVPGIDAQESFDIIFSTYVLEHVPAPARHLDALARMLRPGGSLFIFCPRYDVPGYACPSSRHLDRPARLRLQLRAAGYRAMSLVRGIPAFLIQTDLAAFHGPFFTDADAVHWVSLIDLQLWARRTGFSWRGLRLGNSRVASKDWIVKNLLTCAVELRKRPLAG